MPRRRAGVRYASGQSSQSIRFLNTRGEAFIGVALCQRCQIKRRFSELTEDGNINGFMVCLPSLSPGCWDQFEPTRLPAPPPDRMDLPFVRPDVDITIYPDGLLPIGPPVLPPVVPVLAIVRITDAGDIRITDQGDIRVV